MQLLSTTEYIQRLQAGSNKRNNPCAPPNNTELHKQLARILAENDANRRFGVDRSRRVLPPNPGFLP